MATTAAEWRAILQWLSEEYKKYTTVNDFNKAAWRNRPYVGVFVLQCTFLNTIPGGSITQCECVQEHLLIVKDVMLDCLNSLLYRDVLPSVNITTPVAHLVKGLKHILTNLHLSDAFIQSDLQYIQAIHMYCQYVCSLGIEPTTFVLQMQCSTTEPQELNKWPKQMWLIHRQQLGRYWEVILHADSNKTKNPVHLSQSRFSSVVKYRVWQDHNKGRDFLWLLEWES